MISPGWCRRESSRSWLGSEASVFLAESPAIAALLRALPKAELHVHLEGAMPPELLLELARRHGVELPAADLAGVRDWFVFRDFEHFVEIYLACSDCLREPEDFGRLAEAFVDAQAAQNVVYSEVHFTISTHLARGLCGDEIAEALSAAFDAGRRRGVEVRLIPDIVRNLEVERADRTLEWALRHQGGLVVALGLAGIEGHPVAPFREHFEEARSAGLATTAHAGEQTGPDAVREVLDICSPERIGHGISAVGDPALIRRLVAERVPLEVCPTSNVRLGYAPSIAEHPLARLWREGVALSISSDDPPLFGTTLLAEYESVSEAFGYSAGEMIELARAAFEHAFLSEEERARYLERFERAVAEVTQS